MNTTLSQKINEAELLLKQGEFKQAQDILGDLLQKYPENPNVLCNCGILAYHTGNEKEAEKFLLKTIATQKDHASGLLNLADLYASQKRWEHVSQLLLSSPFIKEQMNPDAFSRLGVAFFKQNKNDLAQKYFQKSFDLRPNEAIGRTLISLKKKSPAPQTTQDEREQYNTVYSQGGWNQEYRKHYSECIYYPVWEKVLEWIKKISKPSILDIGCGPGQVANMLFDHMIPNYRGIDFSSTAIQMAKERNPSFKHCFSVDDAYTTTAFNTHYSIVLLLEILEHVNEDLYILQRIRNDTSVIFSVPNFPSATHIRWFPSLQSATARYKTCIKIKQAVTIQLPHTINVLYLFEGLKKNV